MKPEEEAHWRYHLEILTSWGYHRNHVVSPFENVPDDIVWLREEARYRCHLADVHRHRSAQMAEAKARGAKAVL